LTLLVFSSLLGSSVNDLGNSKDAEAQFAKKIVEIAIIKYFIFINMQITSEIGYLQFYEN
jgi:hypothetical protein